jgi:sodium/potassium/calcium exchanger 6
MVIKVGNGAKAKGALWRDMIMLMLTIGMVLFIFLKGRMYKSQAVLFIFMYFAFAVIVLIADLYHRRKVIVPAVVTGSRMVARRLSTIRRPSMISFAPQAVAARAGALLGGAVSSSPNNRNNNSSMGLNTEMLAQEDMMDTDSDTEDSSDLDSKDEDWKYQNKKYKEDMFKAIESPEDDSGEAGGDAQSQLNTGNDLDVESNCDYLPLVDGMETLSEPMNDKAMININEFFFQFYHKSHESMHAISRKMKQEGWKFFYEETLLNKVLIVLEMPFTVARLVTIPAVDSDIYFKPFFVASCIGIPWWVLFNLGSNQPAEWGKLSITICVCCSVVLGLLSHVLAPSKNPPMIKLGTKFPFGLAVICLVSFILAALWINVVATELVSVISFIGNIAAIDESILGLTVIAWGNSIGDFSTNMAMAKRGLSNVSMTASFAGPVFNILVGLGFGFLYYFQYEGSTFMEVELNIVIALAFICIILNCLMLLISSLFNGFHIPKRAGYISISIYCVYIIIGIVCVATNTTLDTTT